MITFHLKPKEYVEGTEYDRLTEYDSVSVDDNGLEFYETDTSILWRVCAGAWLAINIGGGGGSTTFTGLTDTPASFAGAGGQLVAVNGAANALEFVDLPAHNIVGASHTVTGAALDVVGLTAINTLGLITPSSNPGATEKILKTAAGGALTIRALSTSVSLTVSGVLSLNGGGGALLHDSSGSPGVSGQFLKNVSTGQTDWANINITDLSGTGSQYDVVGFTASNTIGVLTPASDPAGANVVLLRTNTSGNINLQSGLTFNAAATISTTAGLLTISGTSGTQFSNYIGVNLTPVSSRAIRGLVDTTTAGTTAIAGEFITTINSAQVAYGALFNPQVNRGATVHASSVIGFETRPQILAGQTANVTGVLIGFVANIYHAGSGTLSTARAMQINDVALGGAVTNNYGLYIGAMVAGATNFAVYTNAGTNYFGDNVGIRVSAPRGDLHTHDGVGGSIHWSNAAVDGTAQTVIPNGTGDVVYYSHWMFVVRHSGGGVNASNYQIAPGASAALYNVAGNTCTIAVAANGSVTVQRTAGTGTYAVTLWGIWL